MQNPPSPCKQTISSILDAQIGRNFGLIGDLLEEYAAGRSAAWYWRQTIGAIILTIKRDSLPLVASRALALGGLYSFCSAKVFNIVIHWLQFNRDWRAAGCIILWVTLVNPGIAGWLIGRSFQSKYRAIVPICAAALILYNIGEMYSNPVPIQLTSDIAARSLLTLSFLIGASIARRRKEKSHASQ